MQNRGDAGEETWRKGGMQEMRDAFPHPMFTITSTPTTSTIFSFYSPVLAQGAVQKINLNEDYFPLKVQLINF